MFIWIIIDIMVFSMVNFMESDNLSVENFLKTTLATTILFAMLWIFSSMILNSLEKHTIKRSLQKYKNNKLPKST